MADVAVVCSDPGTGLKVCCPGTWRGQRCFALRRSKHPSAHVEVGPLLDLNSNESVRAFAKEINDRKVPVHILINNAGSNADKPWYCDGIGGLCQVRAHRSPEGRRRA